MLEGSLFAVGNLVLWLRAASPGASLKPSDAMKIKAPLLFGIGFLSFSHKGFEGLLTGL